MKTFKVLSAILSYPSAELVAAAGDLAAALDTENLLPRSQRRALDTFLRELGEVDLYELQERYVILFDRSRSLSLHLFEHVHGESRDRGQAMIDLKSLYETNGLGITATELPDYLPLFLEFLSTRPMAEATELLGQTVHILTTLAERLHKRQSSYSAVLHALIALSRATPKADELAAVLPDEGVDPDDLEALDAAWEEEPVTFGPSAAASCGKDGLIAKLRAARRPAGADTNNLS